MSEQLRCPSSSKFVNAEAIRIKRTLMGVAQRPDHLSVVCAPAKTYILPGRIRRGHGSGMSLSKPALNFPEDRMTMKPGLRDILWMAVGAAALFAVSLLVLHFRDLQTPAAQQAFKTKRLELVERMRLSVALAAEAEKSAVMAITDEDSQTYADHARTATGAVEQGRRELEQLLQSGGTKNENASLTRFSGAFAEFQRIDKDLLDLAVKNTNLKAYSLAFGPAAEAIREMDTALARVVTTAGNSPSANDLKVMQLADGARIAALRLLTLLPPHIAEESDQKMDEMEAVMTNEGQAVHQNLVDLSALPTLSGNPDLAAATVSFARFAELKKQILKLSRENTNVRSLTISLNQKRKVMLVCQDALAALEQAIQEEPIAGLSNRTPIRPR